MDLHGKNAIVTGGASGIGKAIVKRLAAEGANVFVFDISDSSLLLMHEEMPDVVSARVDVSDFKECKAAIAELFANSQIDVLVNNAGMVSDSPLLKIHGEVAHHDVELWDKVVAVNMTAPFYMACLSVMNMVKNRAKGVIVNISSIASSGNPGQTAYSASKAGVLSMTRVWAEELAPFGIRVAAVSPGFTDTEITKKMDDAAKIAIKKRIPLRRFATTEEIADGVVFVLKNEYFNGASLPLDGGLRM